MNLRVFLPTKILINQQVSKVVAEAQNGSFCILPRHVDFITALVPGLLSFQVDKGKEEFLAVDDGILVKCGSEVLISTRNAMYGHELGQLKQTVEKEFRTLDEKEKKARSVLSKIEAHFIKRFMELKKNG